MRHIDGPHWRGCRVLHLCRDFQEASAQLLEKPDGVSDVVGEKNKGHGSKDSFCMHLVGDAVVMSPGGDGLLWVFHDKEISSIVKHSPSSLFNL